MSRFDAVEEAGQASFTAASGHLAPLLAVDRALHVRHQNHAAACVHDERFRRQDTGGFPDSDRVGR